MRRCGLLISQAAGLCSKPRTRAPLQHLRQKRNLIEMPGGCNACLSCDGCGRLCIRWLPGLYPVPIYMLLDVLTAWCLTGRCERRCLRRPTPKQQRLSLQTGHTRVSTITRTIQRCAVRVVTWALHRHGDVFTCCRACLTWACCSATAHSRLLLLDTGLQTRAHHRSREGDGHPWSAASQRACTHVSPL